MPVLGARKTSREHAAVQEADRLNALLEGTLKENTEGSPRGERGRSPIGGLNNQLSKFKSIDLNLIQAIGNKNQRSTSQNCIG